MTELSDRRNFFGALVRGAARNTQTIASAALPMPVAALMSATRPAEADSKPEFSLPAQAPRAQARVPARTASLRDLNILAGAAGLGHRRDELRTIATESIRLCPADDGEGDGWLAGTRTLAGLAVGEEHLVAQLHLGAPQLEATPLAGSGWLHLYVTGWAGSPSTSSHRVAAARATVHDQPLETPEPGANVAMHKELVIPRVWSAYVGDLSLETDENDAYLALRRDLATIQGVEAEDDGGTKIAYQRLLGYPNETSGLMPKMCAETCGEPMDAPHRDWRLVAQLSPVNGSERLYFWSRAEDLIRGDLTRLIAVTR